MRYFLSVDTDPGVCNVLTGVILIVAWSEGGRVLFHFHYFEFPFFFNFLFFLYLIDYQ